MRPKVDFCHLGTDDESHVADKKVVLPEVYSCPRIITIANVKKGHAKSGMVAALGLPGG